ncbi:MAG: hypothetical protein MJA32_06700 [Proteobacteria bacterium]|nr:hypothetical protein [Pseudomonadota bacterium]
MAGQPGPQSDREFACGCRSAWRPLEHWLLIGGILLIVLSFATDLFFVRPGQH